MQSSKHRGATAKVPRLPISLDKTRTVPVFPESLGDMVAIFPMYPICFIYQRISFQSLYPGQGISSLIVRGYQNLISQDVKTVRTASNSYRGTQMSSTYPAPQRLIHYLSITQFPIVQAIRLIPLEELNCQGPKEQSGSDQRKRQNTPDWQVTDLTLKDTYIQGLSLAAAK